MAKPANLKTLDVSNSKEADVTPRRRYQKLTRAYGIYGAYQLQNRARELDFPDGVFWWQNEKDGMIWYFREFEAEGKERTKKLHRLGKTVTDSLPMLSTLIFGEP